MKKDTWKDYVKFICVFSALWLTTLIPSRWFDAIIRAFPKVKEQAKKIRWSLILFIAGAFWLLMKLTISI